jgi:hypothetical protein
MPTSLGKGQGTLGVKDIFEEVFWKDLDQENEFLKDLVLQTHNE